MKNPSHLVLTYKEITAEHKVLKHVGLKSVITYKSVTIMWEIPLSFYTENSVLLATNSKRLWK